MYRRFHDRLGTAGVVIAVVALIATLGGTALAASGALTGKQKKEVEKIAKKYAGKPGAPGTNGTNGTNGAPGKEGPEGKAGNNGQNVTLAAAGSCPEGGTKVTVGAESKEICNGVKGTNGTNGKSVLNGNGAPSAGTGTEGDFYIDTENDEIYGPKAAGGWGSGTSLKGETGFTETLPPGKTETGNWEFSVAANSPAFRAVAPISFAIPLAAALDEAHVRYLTKLEWQGHTGPFQCPGTALDPEATSGNLCVYGDITEGIETPPFFGADLAQVIPAKGAGKSGAVMLFLHNAEEETYRFGEGTWAVTG